MRRLKYALITPAKNEERFIRKTLDSVCAQSILPVRWVIVDDGSSDRTAEIVEEYASLHKWVDLVRLPPRGERNFAAKANAVNLALRRMNDIDFDIVGNLDADVSFPTDYMEFLLDQFEADTSLGVAGTPFTQDGGYDSSKDSFEGENYVAGPCQLFRLACFRQIGGYVASASGGVDWIAVMSARVKGWRARSFLQKRYHHYRSMGTAQTSMTGACYDYGKRAYLLGSSPLWHGLRVLYRMIKPPYVWGGLALFAGYFFATIRRLPRPIDDKILKYNRREQHARLRSFMQCLITLRKVETFHVPDMRSTTAAKR